MSFHSAAKESAVAVAVALLVVIPGGDLLLQLPLFLPLPVLLSSFRSAAKEFTADHAITAAVAHY
jgi:hypothetical protein